MNQEHESENSSTERPLPKTEVHRHDFLSSLFDFLKTRGFEETLLMRETRRGIVARFGDQTKQQLEESGRIKEFGFALGDYQDIVRALAGRMPTDDQIRLVMDAQVFFELGWSEELQQVLAEVTQQAGNLTTQTEMEYQLLGEALLLKKRYRDIFEYWREEAGESASESAFAQDMLDVGFDLVLAENDNKPIDEDIPIMDILERGTREMESFWHLNEDSVD